MPRIVIAVSLLCFCALGADGQNVRSFSVPCSAVWKEAVPIFVDKSFHPTLSDKESFTASFASDSGLMKIPFRKNNRLAFLRQYTNAAKSLWTYFRIDSASLYLREDQPGACVATIKMSYTVEEQTAVFVSSPDDPPGRFYKVESNFAFETVLLDAVASKVK